MKNYGKALIRRLLPKHLPYKEIKTTLDLPNQRVISNDVNRTRVNKLSGRQKHELEQLLTVYCKTHKVTYKQGMNEVAALFILLNLPLPQAYACFVELVDRAMNGMFSDIEFRTL